jgi:hypothetical protein
MLTTTSSPRPSSSQPTGCDGRRLPTSAPTVAALTAATSKGMLAASSTNAACGEPEPAHRVKQGQPIPMNL